MSNIRKHPTCKGGRAEFYAGTMRLSHNRGKNFTCFQINVIHNFKAMGDETLYQELPPTHQGGPKRMETFVFSVTEKPFKGFA